MIKLSVGLGVLILGALATTLPTMAEGSGPQSGNARVRLGTFDSRAVAVAYYRSDLMKIRIGAVRKEMQEAQAAGDRKQVQAIQDRMKEMQKRMHRRGFGTAPVDDILKRIQDQLPGLAAEAGVDVIVSKWDLIYSGPTVAATDVTDLLLKPFHPDQATLKVVEQLRRTDPVPLKDLKADD